MWFTKQFPIGVALCGWRLHLQAPGGQKRAPDPSELSHRHVRWDAWLILLVLGFKLPPWWWLCSRCWYPLNHLWRPCSVMLLTMSFNTQKLLTSMTFWWLCLLLLVPLISKKSLPNLMFFFKQFLHDPFWVTFYVCCEVGIHSVWIPALPSSACWKDGPSYIELFRLKIIWPHRQPLTSEPSNLVHCPTCSSLGRFHAIFISIALY